MTRSIPPGYRAVPLDASPGRFSWPACVLARESGASGTELVMLANVPDARAFLGCVLDSAGKVREWLQLWVQNLEDFGTNDTGLEDQVSSAQLDRRWRTHW